MYFYNDQDIVVELQPSQKSVFRAESDTNDFIRLIFL